jgi:hypothetical protein|tara:strand:- start:1679 stop:1858 length:180 start_codon:yes stop_codon:yes gene_type:complete
MINRTDKWKSYAVKLAECLEAAHVHIDTQRRVISELRDNEILGSKKSKNKYDNNNNNNN